MESYKPLEDYLSILGGDDDDDDFSSYGESDYGSQDDQNSALYNDWVDLHENTKKNLKVFEQSSFSLPDSASGDEAVVNLVRHFKD